MDVTFRTLKPQPPSSFSSSTTAWFLSGCQGPPHRSGSTRMARARDWRKVLTRSDPSDSKHCPLTDAAPHIHTPASHTYRSGQLGKVLTTISPLLSPSRLSTAAKRPASVCREPQDSRRRPACLSRKMTAGVSGFSLAQCCKASTSVVN